MAGGRLPGSETKTWKSAHGAQCSALAAIVNSVTTSQHGTNRNTISILQIFNVLVKRIIGLMFAKIVKMRLNLLKLFTEDYRSFLSGHDA